MAGGVGTSWHWVSGSVQHPEKAANLSQGRQIETIIRAHIHTYRQFQGTN